MSRYRQALVAVLGLALLASLYVTAIRYSKERQSKHVEITMDWTDFDALARSYGYNEEQFLIELRRAGLTSIAIGEELGSAVGTVTPNAAAFTGAGLINQARVTPLANPTLARLVRSGKIDPNFEYLIVFNDATYQRYVRDLPVRFGARAIRILNRSNPYVIAIRTQSDFFNGIGLGIPEDQFALARKLHLIVDPRVQNDERYGAPQIDALFSSFNQGAKLGTVIFMGLANEVVGYPNHLHDTADAFKRSKLPFGAIEWYDRAQDQRGTEALGTLLPGRVTRVQAISKTELDKLSPQTEIARYILGVRERNIRVVYLRPYAHLWEKRSIEATNVAIVREIAAGLRSRGFPLGHATPVPPFRINPLVIILVSLAVPAIFLLMLEAFGIADLRLAIALCALDVVIIGLGYAAHHDMAVRKLDGLAAALLFPVAAAIAIAPVFRGTSGENPYVAGLRALAIGIGVALAGALVVIGLLSTPLTMEEIDRFFGVKTVLVVPPLAILALYWTTPIFGGRLTNVRESLNSPVRIIQLAVLGILAIAAFFVVIRSGNQPDVTPSTLELLLRTKLTALLSVRPRFKEFVAGWPFLMLLSTLIPSDRRAWGWVFALAVGAGLSDVLDTFSHLHTPLTVSIVRVVLGAILGAIIGAIAIFVYRMFRKESSSTITA
ncbi:MAG: DUF5693 family protein [Vulcanimicrobiaceae bacterium]